MNAVELEEFPFLAKPVEQERYPPQLPAAGNVAEYLLELAGVVHAEVGRQADADQEHRRLARQAGIHDGFEVGTHGIQGRSTQAVVGAELDDDQRRAVRFERAIDPTASPGRGFPADTGVDYPIIESFRAQALPQQAHPALFL